MNTQNACPRGGYLRLTDSHGKVHVTGTSCKVWRCEVCQKTLKMKFEQRIQYGCSKMAPWFLITATFAMGFGMQRDAASVRAVWERWLRRLQKYEQMNPMWLKVTELTRKGQPHLHLILGNVGKIGEAELQQRMRKHWYYVTGDSYILDVVEGYDPLGISHYLAKYLMKAFHDREYLESLGFNRRWSCSRNFPRGEEVQLRGTFYGEWTKREFANGIDNAREMKYLAVQDEGNWLLQPEGDPFYVKKALVSKRRAKVKKIEALQNEFKSVSAHIE